MEKKAAKVKITLVKSVIGRRRDHRATVTGIGLRRIGHTVERTCTPQMQGMIRKVRYLLAVEES